MFCFFLWTHFVQTTSEPIKRWIFEPPIWMRLPKKESSLSKAMHKPHGHAPAECPFSHLASHLAHKSRRLWHPMKRYFSQKFCMMQVFVRQDWQTTSISPQPSISIKAMTHFLYRAELPAFGPAGVWTHPIQGARKGHSPLGLDQSQNVYAYYQPADILFDHAKDFWKNNGGTPWLLYLHLMEPHDPILHTLFRGTEEYSGVAYGRKGHENPDPSERTYQEPLQTRSRILRSQARLVLFPSQRKTALRQHHHHLGSDHEKNSMNMVDFGTEQHL